MKMDSLGSWFDGLATSGRDPVRPEALEGRTVYLQSSPSAALRINSAKQSEPPEIALSLTLLAMTFQTRSARLEGSQIDQPHVHGPTGDIK